jgi:hypothetical protein
MTFDGNRLMELLPAVYRLRDIDVAAQTAGVLTPAETTEIGNLEASLATLDATKLARLEELRDKERRGPLAALLMVLGDQFGVLEEDLAQLYDDQFVETAAAWALPYIGDLIGYRNLHGHAPGVSSRAELAHTIAFRRRKGTASMLEQLARDVTGWPAHVVESFTLLATTQYMNHRRLQNRVTPSVREGSAMELVGTAFDPVPRTLDVRRMGGARGRHNVANVGIFLWRIQALGTHRSPATPDPGDLTLRRFRFSPLGDDAALWTRPEREDEIEQLSQPINVPFPISRRRLNDDLVTALETQTPPRLYGAERSLAVFAGGIEWPPEQVSVCNLSDASAGAWAHEAPDGMIAIDPVLGRLAVAADLSPGPGPLEVSFHRGGPSSIGGGEYDRAASFADNVSGPVIAVPSPAHLTIQDAIDAIAAQGGSGVVEIHETRRYIETLSLEVPAGGALEIRALNRQRPTIELGGPWTIGGGPQSRVFLNGLLVAGNGVSVQPLLANGDANALAELLVAHSTLVPGRSLNPDGSGVQPGATSVSVAVRGTRLSVDSSITGALRVHDGATASIDGSIVDAAAAGVAYGASDAAPADPGGDLDVESSTLIGQTLTRTLCASNAILLGLVQAVRTQDGCVRFSYLPPGSHAPRRYRCQPGDGAAAVNVPHFVSLRFGSPAYARLAGGTPDGIARGAEDESEMGVYRRQYEPQRHADLLTRLDEYLRVGLEAGVIHES